LLIGVLEAARLLGVSRETIFRLLAEGELRRTRVRGRTLIQRDDVLAFIERQTTAV
jgi:excisionase family DNA binding protein